MPKFKQRRRKLKAKAKRLFKKKEASHFQSKLITPPPPPPSPERVGISSIDISQSRSWLTSSWNFNFPNIRDAIKLWTNRVWSIYSWCQNCITQVWMWHPCFQRYSFSTHLVFIYIRAQVSPTLKLNLDKMKLLSQVCLCFYKNIHQVTFWFLFSCPYHITHRTQNCLLLISEFRSIERHHLSISYLPPRTLQCKTTVLHFGK